MPSAFCEDDVARYASVALHDGPAVGDVVWVPLVSVRPHASREAWTRATIERLCGERCQVRALDSGLEGTVKRCDLELSTGGADAMRSLRARGTKVRNPPAVEWKRALERAAIAEQQRVLMSLVARVEHFADACAKLLLPESELSVLRACAAELLRVENGAPGLDALVTECLAQHVLERWRAAPVRPLSTSLAEEQGRVCVARAALERAARGWLGASGRERVWCGQTLAMALEGWSLWDRAGLVASRR
jgi:hypothetical protein